MEEKANVSLKATPEQLLYASLLEKGMYFGLLILFITFGLYALGIMDPYIPLDKISRYWSMNVNDYLKQADIHAGWAWVGMLKYGDFVNFIGIAMLSGVTILCYAAILPTLLKNKDTVYAVLAVLEVIVLSVAASGILGAGGH
ncbi:MAG: DUF1634 domain-containing protein [Pseudomonadota bacterium]|uniref:DUF1634 domain-containing protein n=1 Tax=Candidatus Desulfatibia profunda TaxID=2841695 RepID=A0A8J6NRP7_9BACT|nr:DUF1634 domain-containing protein [Candidatus Desulfatibia profunda]